MNFNTYLSIPEELVPRVHTLSIGVGIVLFVAFLLLAFARLARPTIYGNIGVAMLKTTGLRAFIRESLPLNKRSSFLLLINYWLSGSLIIYLWLDTFGWSWLERLIYASGIPLALLIGGLGSMVLTGWITGERDVMKAPRIMKIIGAQTLGVIYFLCALIWVLNSSYQDVIIQIVAWSFVAESVFRIIKSVTTVYAAGVSWYYIILYFCTLEILPLFVVYYFVWLNFAN